MEQLEKLASVAIGPLKLGDLLSAVALFIVCYLVIRLRRLRGCLPRHEGRKSADHEAY